MIIHHYNIGFILEMPSWFNINQCHSLHKQNKGEKLFDCQKILIKLSTDS